MKKRKKSLNIKNKKKSHINAKQVLPFLFNYFLKECKINEEKKKNKRKTMINEFLKIPRFITKKERKNTKKRKHMITTLKPSCKSETDLTNPDKKNQINV